MTTLDSSALFSDLHARGLVHQSTDEEGLRSLLSKPTSFFVGFDPTADSLHLGSFLQLMMAKRLQLAGHRPVLLVGGGTGLIGDPKESGERPLLSRDDVDNNASKVEDQLRSFFGPEVRIVNNADWLCSLTALDFLRDVGKHFTVNKLLSRSIVDRREDGMSFTEFSFTLLQGFDFLELSRREAVRLQIGGSDQWGNMVSGMELARRMDGTVLHSLTSPLLLKSDGTKFGKTESGTLWLDPAKTPLIEVQQALFNVRDDEVERMLLQLTLLSVEEVSSIMAAHNEAPSLRRAQRTLSFEVISLLHGSEIAKSVARAQEALFNGKVDGLEKREIEVIVASCPAKEVEKASPTIEELFLTSGLVKSKSDFRRAVKERSLHLNGVRVMSEGNLAPTSDLWVLRRGKTMFILRRS